MNHGAPHALRCGLRCTAVTIAFVLASAGTYVGAAAVLMLWPVQVQPTPHAADVEAYVLSNGVHIDYLLPVRSSIVDWTEIFSPADVKAMPPDAAFVAIGWGNREFFLHTHRWGDLTAARAFGALSGQDRALLHVSWLRRSEVKDEAYAVPLSDAQYSQLVRYVRSTLPGARGVPVPNLHYGVQDAFYEARGNYHLFETCNTWAGRGLRQAGAPVSRWTPFEPNVVWRLERAEP